jgi:hypothetical protein
MTNPLPRPDTINRLANAVPLGLAMLAGMELELFTHLKDGPMTNEKIAAALGVGPGRLKALLYGLAAAGLLTVEGELFANSPEADRFLVQGKPAYVGWWHNTLGSNWAAIMKSASSIKTGQPQDKTDFSTMSDERLDDFARRSYPRVAAMARSLLEKYDLSSYRNLIDVGGGTGALAVAITKACPGLIATVVDQPKYDPSNAALCGRDGRCRAGPGCNHGCRERES